MKKMIFIVVVFACGLSQCKKSEYVSATASDKKLVRNTEADTAKNIVKDMLPLDIKSTQSANVDADDSTASNFIRKFYKEYLLGLDNDFADSVKRKYCTPELIKKLANKKLDYDPFLNAQDFDDNLLKTLDVKKSNDPLGYYVVSYVDGYSKKNVYIAMRLAEREGGYKISDLIIRWEPGNEK